MISANILHKDDMLNLIKCINSVYQISDEIIVVDSGGHDYSTILSYYPKVKVIRYEGDFSYRKARNLAIMNSSFDWILSIDSDEELMCGQEDKIKRLLKDNSNMAFAFVVVNYYRNGLWSNFPITKLFHKMGNEILYEKDIHETVNYSLKRKGIIPSIEGIYIHHSGYLHETGYLLNKQAQYLKLLEKQIEKTPNDAASYWYLAVSNMALGHTDEAYRNIEKAISLEPNNKIPYIFKARFLMEDRDYNRVIATLQSAISIKEGPFWDPTIENLIGMACMMLGNFTEAREHLSAALQGQPWASNVLINIAVCDLHIGEKARCRMNCQKAVSLLPRILDLRVDPKIQNPFSFQQDVSPLFMGIQDLYDACK